MSTTAHNDSNIRLFLPKSGVTEENFNRLVCLTATSGEVRLCGLGDTPIGVLRKLVTVESITYAVVRIWGKNGTIQCVQGGAISPHSRIKAGADGKVIAAGSGDLAFGIKLSSGAGVDDDEIEIHDFYEKSYSPAAVMVGATENEPGTAGTVPAPVAGEHDKYLGGDGKWKEGTNVIPFLLKHKTVLAEDYTIQSSEQAMAVGSLEIPDGIKLTINGRLRVGGGGGEGDSIGLLTGPAGGALEGSYPNPDLKSSSVTAAFLTGLNTALTGTIAATDSVLQAFGKLANRLAEVWRQSSFKETLGGVHFDGSAGKTAIADNESIEFSTADFTLSLLVKLPDTTPASDIVLLDKVDSNLGFRLSLLTSGKLRLQFGNGADLSTYQYDSTAALDVADGKPVRITITADRDGSVMFYDRKHLLESGVDISGSSNQSLESSADLVFFNEAANYTEGELYDFKAINRVLSASEIALLDDSGQTDPSDRWGSMANQIADEASNAYFTNGTTMNWSTYGGGGTVSVDDANDELDIGSTTNGHGARLMPVSTKFDTVPLPGELWECEIDVEAIDLDGVDYWRVSLYDGTHLTTFLNITETGKAKATMVIADGTTSSAFVLFNISGVPTGSGASISISAIRFRKIGCFVDLNCAAGDIQLHDRSENQNHALCSSSGVTALADVRRGQLRGKLSWNGTHEAQIFLAAQDIIPDGAKVSISAQASTGTPSVIIGDQSDNDRYVELADGALSTEWQNLSMTKEFSDGTNQQLLVDPSANYTGTIELCINWEKQS